LDGKNHDSKNIFHHVGNNWDWDDYSRWYGQIAGDCVDLNTENPLVSNYLVECYGKLIAMGVDGFRIDTSGHISRLTFNKAFIPQFTKLAEQHKAKRNGGPFFMFGEVCARGRDVTYRNHENCSPYFYTWKETKEYAWTDDPKSWEGKFLKEGEFGDHTNMNSTRQQGKDYNDDSGMPTSKNAKLNGNNYHKPDYSKYSNFSVIDFPMHWSFENAGSAWNVIGGDELYNDATYNVVYVDSHDYSPDGQSTVRFAGSQDTWAENASLMFTFRGIPCIYYGSEIEFRKGVVIDQGPNGPLANTGRAYFGGYITGDVKTTGFAEYTASGNANATLTHPLALHFQRLNQIRMAVPALRKGQYSTDGCSGSFAFKRRYTDDKTDSFALICISGNATFSGVPNGKYTDVVTGNVINVTNGTLKATCSGRGNLRVYVLDTDKTNAPGKVGKDGKYIYSSSPVSTPQASYDGKQEAASGNSGGGPSVPVEPDVVIDPCLAKGEKAVFFQAPQNWGKTINLYLWGKTNENDKPLGAWSGTAMKYLGNGNYKITFNADYSGYNFIFNDGSNQTKDLSDLKLGAMYDSNGNVVKTIAEGDCEADPGTGDDPSDDPIKPDPVTPSIKPGEQCVFFDSPGWSTTYCYAWYEKDGQTVHLTGTWPGTTCESIGGNIFKYSFDKTIGDPVKWNVIFNNGNSGVGTNQTEDLVCENAKMYKMDGSSVTVGVEDALAEEIDVYSYDRIIFVMNAEGREVAVRSLDGRVIYSGVNNAIPVANAGIYLVTVEDTTLKIMVK
jgi:glycosidase